MWESAGWLGPEGTAIFGQRVRPLPQPLELKEATLGMEPGKEGGEERKIAGRLPNEAVTNGWGLGTGGSSLTH